MQDAQLAGGPIVIVDIVVVVVVEEARSTDVPSRQLKIQRDKNGPSDKERRAGVGGGRKRTKAMGKKRSHSRRAGKEGGGSRKARMGKATSMTERRGVKWDRDDGNASDDVSGGLLTMLRC